MKSFSDINLGPDGIGPFDRSLLVFIPSAMA